MLGVVKNNKLFLGAIFVLSFVLNVSFFHFFLKKNKDYLRGDTPEYHNVAVQIAKGHGIVDEQLIPNYYRVPGYALFLALCYKVFDFDIEKMLYLQCFLAAFIPVLVFLLSLVFFPTSVLLAKWSSFFMMCNLGTVLYAGVLMSETVFMVFFLLFLIFLFSGFNLFFCKRIIPVSYKKLFFAGVFLGIVSLIRPVGHFIVIIVFLLLLCAKERWKTKVVGNGVFFLGWVLIVSWWLVRNFLLTGGLFFHSMPGNHFLIFFAPDIVAKEEKISFHEARTRLQKERDKAIKEKEKLLGRTLNDFEQQKIAQKVANKYLKKYPTATLKQAVFNIGKTLFGFHASILVYKYAKNFPGYSTSISWWQKFKHYLFFEAEHIFLRFFIYFEFLWLLIVYLGFMAGLVYAFFHKGSFCVLAKTLPITVLLILLTIGIGLARLRFPVEPLLVIKSFSFWLPSIQFFRRKNHLRRRRGYGAQAG